MADNISQSDLDKSLKSSKELSSAFKEIQTAMANFNVEFAQSGDFAIAMKNAISESEKQINKLSNVADQYNLRQKLTEQIQERVNELKSRGLYYDGVSAQLKIQQLQGEIDINQEMIKQINSLNTLTEKQKEYIENLKIIIDQKNLEIIQVKNLTTKYDTINKTIDNFNNTNKNITIETEKQLDFIQEMIGQYNKMIEQAKEQSSIALFFYKSILDSFAAIETAAFKTRKSFGLLRDDAKDLYSTIEATTVDFGNLGVDAEKVSEVVNTLGDVFGSAAYATKEIVGNLSVLEVSLGTTSENSVKALKNFAGISNSTVSSQQSMLGFTYELAKASKTPLKKVMEDISTLADSVRLTFRGTTSELVQASIAARKLGLSLEIAGTVAEKLLDFQESINAEIEASVTLGRNISFQDARVLAYKGEISKAVENVLSTVEKTVDLNKVDYFTLKNIAAATGLTVTQLQDSLAIKKSLNELDKLGTDEAKAAAEEYRKLQGLNKENQKISGNAALKRIQETNNLERQKQVMQELKSLAVQIVQAILPFLRLIAGILDGLTSINNAIRDLFPSSIGEGIKTFFGAIEAGILAYFLFKPIKSLSKLKDKAVEIGGYIKKIFTGKTNVPTPTDTGPGGATPTIPTTPTGANQSMGQKIKKFLTEVSKGIQSFRKVQATDLLKVGGAGLAFASLALGTPGFLAAALAGRMADSIKSGMKAIASGIEAFGKNPAQLFTGIGAMALIGVIAIGFAYAMKLLTEVSWKEVGIAIIALGSLVLAVMAIGAIMNSGVGTLAILGGAAAIALIGAAMAIAAGAFLIFANANNVLADAFLKMNGVDATKVMAVSAAASTLALTFGSPFGLLSGFGLLLFSGALMIFAKALEMITNSVGTFSTSISTLLDKLAYDNMDRIASGVGRLKNSISELRGELKNFNGNDIQVLDKLSNLAVGFSASGQSNKEEKTNTELKQAIKDAILQGMQQVKIDVNLNGSLVGRGMAKINSFTNYSGETNMAPSIQPPNK